MLTIKLFLAESGSVATIDKDFPLYQGQFQNILLNVFVPLSTLAPDFTLSTNSGQYDGLNTPYVAGTTVSVSCQTVKRNGTIATSKSYNLRFVKNISKNGVGYALFERKLPKEFTTYAGVAPAGLTMICNVTNVSYGQIDQEQTKATSAKGAVSVDFVALTKQVPAVTQNYTFTYDTNETPASWYLYGVKVGLATYGLSIAWTPANGDTISLSVVASDPSTISVLTTQTVKYDVFPSSDLDEDTPEDASALQALQAQVNSATARITDVVIGLSTKQNIYDETLETQNKTVPTAINELNTEVTDLDTRVTKNEKGIADLKKTVITGITYVGSFSYAGDGEPTDKQLTDFVIEQEKRTPIGGDFVLAVREIPDATDIIYACIYSKSSMSWDCDPIPGLELASDNNAGLIQGGSSDKLYVKIVGGVIQEITANADSGYPAVSVSNLGRMYADIVRIKSGDIVVGKANIAFKDGNGKIISDYYMPNSIGATRNFVRQYALPVEFNDALYVSANGLVKEVPTTPASGEQFAVNSSSTGYTTLFTVAYNLNNDGGTKFQLSKKNSYNADLFVKAASSEEVQFVVDLTAGADPTGEGNTTLSTHVTLDTLVTTSLTDISVSSLLNELGDNIITLDGSKGNVYIAAKVSVFRTSSTAQTFTVVCNDMYPSCFHLSTAFQTVAVTTGKVGEIPQMIFTGYTVSGSNIVFTPATVVPPDNSVVHVVLPSVPDADKGKTVLLSIGGEDVPINTPNGTNATVEDLYPSMKYRDSGSIGYDFLMSYTAQNDVGDYYVQQGYDKSITGVKFPNGTHNITYDTNDGLTVSGEGKIDYEGKSDTPDMSVSIPLKAGNGISMDADTTNRFLVIKAAETAKWVDEFSTGIAQVGSQWQVSVSRQGGIGEKVVYAISPGLNADFFTTNLPVVFIDEEGTTVPLLLISSATYPVNSFDLKQFTDADGEIRIYAVRATAGHILFNTGAFVSSSPRSDAASGGDITEIQIGDFKYTLNKDAINGKLDKAETSADNKNHVYGYKAKTAGGVASQIDFIVERDSPTVNTIPRRRPDGSILVRRSNAEVTSNEYRYSAVANEQLDEYVAGTASTDGTADTIAQRDAEGALKAATKTATSANAAYVATISNIVATNGAVTGVSGRVTTLEGKHLYLHCITLSKDAGSDDTGYGVSFNVISAKSSSYASYSTLATAIGANFKTSASGILYASNSDKQPLHIASAKTASTTTVIFEGSYVTTDGGGGGSHFNSETADVSGATFTDTVSTIY